MRSIFSMSAVPILVAAAASCLPGCAPPERNLSSQDEVSALGSREEVMWFLATVADPGFKAAANASGGACGDAEFALFADMGRRVPWAASRLQAAGFSAGAEFDGFARDLAARAGELLEAAGRKDGPKSVELALAMKKTCKGCHDVYR